MLPAVLVGTVVTASGARPFALDTPTGKVTLGCWREPDTRQRQLGPAERGAIERQVRAELGSVVREVRIGRYRCPRCDRWVDVETAPESWQGETCSRCG